MTADEAYCAALDAWDAMKSAWDKTTHDYSEYDQAVERYDAAVARANDLRRGTNQAHLPIRTPPEPTPDVFLHAWKT